MGERKIKNPVGLPPTGFYLYLKYDNRITLGAEIGLL